MRTSSAIFVCLALVASLGCGPKRTYETYRIPPKIDLAAHEIIGVVQFESDEAAELAPLVTQRFTDLARRDQGLVRMLDIGPADPLLVKVGHDRWGPQTPTAVGVEHNVQTLIVGVLEVSDVRPDLKLASGLRSGRLSAKVDATLTVRLIETATGASLWSSSASATKTVGHVGVGRGGHVSFDAEDPEQAYAPLVDFLVGEVTRDFQASWGRRAL